MALPANVTTVVRTALDEDIGAADLTAQLIPVSARAVADIICRESAILCGTAWFEATFLELDDNCVVSWSQRDGESVEPNKMVCRVEGSARALVTGERTALNFLQTLSGTATTTRRYVEKLAGTTAALLDTRKTIPSLRSAQKYAVRCGGGKNHRMGLFDGILIKENHIEAVGSITEAIRQMRSLFADRPIEIEVETIVEFTEAITAGADIVLLDNFSIDALKQAVALANGRVQLEASGGFEFADIRAIAETGVNFVSVGALTKHLQAIDFSMRFHRGPPHPH